MLCCSFVYFNSLLQESDDRRTLHPRTESSLQSSWRDSFRGSFATNAPTEAKVVMISTNESNEPIAGIGMKRKKKSWTSLQPHVVYNGNKSRSSTATLFLLPWDLSSRSLLIKFVQVIFCAVF